MRTVLLKSHEIVMTQDACSLYFLLLLCLRCQVMRLFRLS